MHISSRLVLILVALVSTSSLAGCATTERNDDTIACPRPLSYQGRLYRQAGTAAGPAVGNRLDSAALRSCTAPDGTELQPVPVVLYDLRSVSPKRALAVRTKDRWTLFARYDARGTGYCTIAGIRCHQS